MEYILFILFVILFLYTRRIKTDLLDHKTKSDSENAYFWTIDASQAIIEHDGFSKITKLKSALPGVAFKNWSSSDKQIWESKYLRSVMDKSFLKLQYMPNDDVYFVRTAGATLPYIATRSHFGNDLLYSEIVLGDTNGFKENIELLVYERWLDGLPYISVGLKHADTGLEYNFNELALLPTFLGVPDEQYEADGFTVKREGGDDFYTDLFGAQTATPTEVSYFKNGIRFSRILK